MQALTDCPKNPAPDLLRRVAVIDGSQVVAMSVMRSKKRDILSTCCEVPDFFTRRKK